MKKIAIEKIFVDFNKFLNKNIEYCVVFWEIFSIKKVDRTEVLMV